jgi:hypothetical protein
MRLDPHPGGADGRIRHDPLPLQKRRRPGEVERPEVIRIGRIDFIVDRTYRRPFDFVEEAKSERPAAAPSWCSTAGSRLFTLGVARFDRFVGLEPGHDRERHLPRVGSFTR